MYATGTRAQEACDLTVKSVNFRSTGTTIDIVGKGSKARRIRIPDTCASMLKKYIKHRRIETEPDRHIFSSQMHERMTISCVEEIYKKYIKLAKEKMPNLFKEEHYSPHSMRHTTGQHMLEAGVPIMVIKAFLENLKVQRIDHHLSTEELTAKFGENGWKQLPDAISRCYKFIPASVEVEEHHIGVYSSKLNEHMVKAPPPKNLLHGSLASPSLAAAIMNRKYVNAIPLYRLEKEFERYGLAITRQNMANWMIRLPLLI